MREIWARIRYPFRRKSHMRDVAEELDTHLQMEVDAKVERGMSPDEARAVVRRQFGSPARLRESVHEAWVFHWLESILQDIRYGLRQFRKAPGLFLAVATSLAAGLGANIAIFSLIDAAVLRPLPVADPDGLVQLEWRNERMPAGARIVAGGRPTFQTEGGLQGATVSEPLFRGFAEQQTAFASVIGVQANGADIAISTTSGAPAVPVRMVWVSRNFFDGLGVPLVLGRSFLAEEDSPGAGLAIIVSHRFWLSRLGGDPNTIGRLVRINDKPARIVGVAPAGFFGLDRGLWIDVYQPMATNPIFQSRRVNSSTYWSITMMARVAPGVSASAASAQMTPLFRNLVAKTTGTKIEEQLELIASPATGGLYFSLGSLKSLPQALWILMLLVGVLLLIVCANVANLLLARSEKRRRESAVRLALGAGHGRLIRQHLVESGMLAVIGGVAGLGLGTLLARSLHTLFQAGQGSGAAFAVVIDWRLTAYAAAISMLTALFFGLAPALTGARSKVSDALKTQSRAVLGGGLRVPRILVSVQFALSFTALVAAGLLGRSLGNLYSTDLGFDAERLSYATVRPAQAGYPFERIDAYLERLEQELVAIPGVLTVAPLEARPLDGLNPGSYVSSPHGPVATLADGIDNPAARALMIRGGPGFIEVLGIPLLTGRTLEARDQCSFGPADTPASGAGKGRPVCPVVVDRRFAEVFFPGETPVGKRFEIPNVTPPLDYEVVGLVANARYGVLREETAPTMYYLGPAGFPMDHFAIRAQIASGMLAAAVQQAVARVDPAVPLAEFHTQSGLIDRLLRTERLLALISSGFGLVALTLAAVGLGGLLSYAVALRTNEIGIRMALGATGRGVRRMVLAESLRMVAAGVLIGVPTAYAVGRYLEGLLHGLKPLDSSTALLALLALIVIAGMATALPARRAVRVSPLTALREE